MEFIPVFFNSAFDGETSGGNGDGKKCFFPFIYNGLSFSTCITDEDKFGPDPFCSVTPNYDLDDEYGFCIEPTGTTAESTDETTSGTEPTKPTPPGAQGTQNIVLLGWSMGYNSLPLGIICECNLRAWSGLGHCMTPVTFEA